MGFRQSGTAPAARHGSVTLRAFAKKSAAHLAWRRETMQRSQAAFSDSHASLPAPGPLTDAAAIRGAHPPRRAVLDRGQAGRSSIGRPRRFWLIVRLLLLMPFFSRALGKASRAQQPHKTRRLIRLLPPQPETRRLTHKPPHLHLESQQDPTATQDAPPHFTPALGPAP